MWLPGIGKCLKTGSTSASGCSQQLKIVVAQKPTFEEVLSHDDGNFNRAAQSDRNGQKYRIANQR